MPQRTTTRERQQNRESNDAANRVHPDFASVQNTDGVAFSRGNMFVNGQAQTPTHVRHWEASNGLSQYTTVQWEDSASGEKRCSCNCPGWAFAKKGKLRRCKHTDDMMGIRNCDATPVDAEPVRIQTVQEAEKSIPRFDGRQLRGIMLD
jgi:hypothetical protein